MATEATEIKVRGKRIQLNEMVLPNQVRPLSEPNQLDGALRFGAFLLILIGSCFIINPMGHDIASVQKEAFLVLTLVIFGFSLLFMSVMIDRSPLMATFAAHFVKSIHSLTFGD